MEYNSFYGGRRGASFIIVKNYKTEQEMIDAFSLGGQYKTVNYDEYVIIDTENKNDITNGKIYRRGYDYTNEWGGAEYIGQIVGPAGLGPHAEVIEKSEVNKKYQDAAATGDQLDYRYGIGTLDTETNDLVPGAKGTLGAREFDDETDKIHWEYFSLRDEHQLESTCYIGFQVPYTVFDFDTKMVEPYKDGDYADTTAAIRDIDTYGEHPFYEKWQFHIPKGVKGDTLRNFKLYTPEQDEALADIGGTEHTLQAGRTVLIYEYWWFDNKQAGEQKRVYLGEYEVINDILIDNDGTVTVKYRNNREDTIFSKRIQWIDSVTLTQAGVFTVNYNNGTEPYITNLKWVEDVLLDHDGTVTLVYNNSETKVFEERVNWIDDIAIDEFGQVTVTYNNDTTDEFEHPIKWINDVSLAPTGELTITFNDDKGPQLLKTLQWITNTQYNASARTLTVNYNTGNSETYDYQFIEAVTLSDEGEFKVIGNGGYDYLTTSIIYPNKVDVTDTGIITVLNNDGSMNFQTNIRWIKTMSIANDRFVINYNNGELETIDEVLLNQIDETVVPVAGDYAYHLLVFNTALEKRGTIEYGGRTGWVDLGVVKDYDGILVGLNIDSSERIDLDDPENAVAELNLLYPNGVEGEKITGKVVTIGPDDDEKRLYAYDYQDKKWFYLGNPSGVKDVRSVIIGKNNDAEVAAAAQLMPTGSLWFVLEGDE